MDDGRSLKTWVACAVIATIFVLAALPKLLGVDMMLEVFEEWRYPPEFMYVVGVMELAGAFLILIPSAARAGFFILIFVMCGAIVTHLMAGEIAMVLVPLAMLIALAVTAARDQKEQKLPPAEIPQRRETRSTTS